MTGRRSAILTYHSLDDSGSVISTPPQLFRRQVEFIAASRIPVLPLNEAIERPGSIAITFDDGFCNIAEHAVPLLDRYHLPATVFIVSQHCGGENNWMSQPSGAVPRLPLLSWQALSGLPSTISIGAHTATHPNLKKLSTTECEREFQTCRQDAEQRLGRPVRWLAYPYGDSSPETRRLAARHFNIAVGTSLRFLSPESDCMNLPRIDSYYLRDSFSVDKLFTRFGEIYIGIRHSLRSVRRLLPA